MANRFRLTLVTPTKIVAETEVTEVTASGEEGEFGVLPGHTEYLALLRPGELRFKEAEGPTRYYSVGQGFAEAGPDQLTILTDSAEEGSSLKAET